MTHSHHGLGIAQGSSMAQMVSHAVQGSPLNCGCGHPRAQELPSKSYLPKNRRPGGQASSTQELAASLSCRGKPESFQRFRTVSRSQPEMRTMPARPIMPVCRTTSFSRRSWALNTLFRGIPHRGRFLSNIHWEEKP